jgi:hypothetical protein
MSLSKDIAVGLNCPRCDDYQLVKSGDIPLCRTIICLSCEIPFNAKETLVSDVMQMLDKFI